MAVSTRRRPYAATDEAIAERRREILGHAGDIVSGAGLQRCSFVAVSEASGFSIGMIQHYFRTRDKLVDATIDQRIGEASEEWASIRARAAGPLEKLLDLVAFAVEGDRTFADAWGFWIELYAAARKDPALRAKLNEVLEEWRRIFLDVLQEALDAGLVNPAHSPDDLTRLLLALVDGLAIQAANGTYATDPERMRGLLYRFAAHELELSPLALEDAGAGRTERDHTGARGARASARHRQSGSTR
jgi:AcrR family transcriptional regulator